MCCITISIIAPDKADSPDLSRPSLAPRRRELLRQIGIAYRLLAATMDETSLPNESLQDYVAPAGANQGGGCGRHTNAGAPKNPVHSYWAADTTVVVGGMISVNPATGRRASDAGPVVLS